MHIPCLVAHNPHASNHQLKQRRHTCKMLLLLTSQGPQSLPTACLHVSPLSNQMPSSDNARCCCPLRCARSAPAAAASRHTAPLNKEAAHTKAAPLKCYARACRTPGTRSSRRQPSVQHHDKQAASGASYTCTATTNPCRPCCSTLLHAQLDAHPPLHGCSHCHR
jgi:hypothetical protein